MLVDPRCRLFDSHDTLTQDDGFRALDARKQQTLREAISTMPIYLVQGPPGVGKNSPCSPSSCTSNFRRNGQSVSFFRRKAMRRSII